MENRVIKASDGYPLSVIYRTPVGESNGTIVLSSATAVKKEFYINFAEFLVKNGYNVLLFDYRGIGKSAPENIKDCTSYMHDWGVFDMSAVINFLVNEKKIKDIIWLGHSVGAQLIGFVDNIQYVKKIIAVNAALGYWKYMPAPQRINIWLLWYVISPVLVKIYGYGTMQKVGWGENLPKNIFLEWRKWCMSKNYYRDCLKDILKTEKFYNIKVPYTAVYTSDDYIANDKTVHLMTKFFPNASVKILKIETKKYSSLKVGHTGIFRKQFHNTLWPELVRIIEE